jgi:hypothetical protein
MPLVTMAILKRRYTVLWQVISKDLSTHLQSKILIIQYHHYHLINDFDITKLYSSDDTLTF